MTIKHLDIGCGSNPRNPFSCDELYGVDIIKQEVSDLFMKMKKCPHCFRKSYIQQRYVISVIGK